jgi:bacillithiol synthase
MTRPFAPAFLSGEPRATALLDDGFRRKASWRAEALARAEMRVDPRVVETLRGSAENRVALLQPGTIAVVSGQQAGLFLGPLYTFYKCISTIAWAKALQQETGRRCVPIFWLQSEDHDFGEIASCFVPPETLALPAGTPGCSVSHIGLPPEIDALKTRLAELLEGQPHAGEILGILREAYLPGKSICAAFGEAVERIFAGDGLVILDPRCEAVARASMPIWTVAIDRAEEIEAALMKRGEELAQAGFDEQVQLRRGSPLVFFHDGSPGGQRRRVGMDERAKLLRAEPLQLSSSALLRPIVQDAILPCAVYLGGPAELSYFAQIAPLYPLFDARPSLRAPRGSFRIVDAHTDKALKALGLTPADVEKPREALLQQLGAKSGALPSLMGELPAILLGLAAKHPALERAARRTQRSVERALQKFTAQHTRLLAEQDRVSSDRITRAQEMLYPHGERQERLHSLPWHAARHGLAALKQLALEHVHPGGTGIEDLYP